MGSEEGEEMYGGYWNSSRYYVESPCARSSSSTGSRQQPSSSTTALLMSIHKQQQQQQQQQQDDDDDDDDVRFGGCRQYLSLTTYPSSYLWIGIQLLWRFVISSMAALLVFYLLTKPPPPHLSIQTTRLIVFEIAEGVDWRGVATNFVTCNVSISILIDNKSSVYALRSVSSPLMHIYFRRQPFAISQGVVEVYAGSRQGRAYKIYGGTINKAMYGGGRNMQDMLDSRRGLPLLVSLTFSSHFPHLFIHPKFHHSARCLLVVYKHQLQHPYNNTTCLLTTSSSYS